jgi:hypothetical protein
MFIRLVAQVYFFFFFSGSTTWTSPLAGKTLAPRQSE